LRNEPIFGGWQGLVAGFRNEPNLAVGAKVHEVAESTVVAAVGGGLACEEARESGGVVDEGFGEAGTVLKEVGFEEAQAAELPLGVGQGVDEFGFLGIGGTVGVAERLDQGGAGLGIFVGEEIELGIEAGFEGVAAGDGFAFGRARAGGFLGVAAIGLNLFVRCHADSDGSRRAGGVRAGGGWMSLRGLRL
jgi:hypothetical protein